ncbi:MAG: hypothetical protein ACREDL_18530, partial [Bradyrhizobium sp.]
IVHRPGPVQTLMFRHRQMIPNRSQAVMALLVTAFGRPGHDAKEWMLKLERGYQEPAKARCVRQ